MRLDWDEIDAQREELEKQFPGWNIWAVPAGDLLRPHVRWSARPGPVIPGAGSAEELAERIRDAHAGLRFPVLATPRSYLARVRKLREHEEHVRIAWQRGRARPRRRAREKGYASESAVPDVRWPAQLPELWKSGTNRVRYS